MRAAPLAARKMKGAARLYTEIHELESLLYQNLGFFSGLLGKPQPEIPQLWALYKEVQDYYEAGMRVPDDVTLLWCDDNWGNIRKLPKLQRQAL